MTVTARSQPDVVYQWRLANAWYDEAQPYVEKDWEPFAVTVLDGRERLHLRKRVAILNTASEPPPPPPPPVPERVTKG